MNRGPACRSALRCGAVHSDFASGIQLDPDLSDFIQETKMLPFFMPGVPEGQEIIRLAELEALVADLRSYCRGQGPSREALESAPSISGWAPMNGSVACRLSGFVEGLSDTAPGLGSTAGVVAIGRSGTWMRSRTGLWRLGPRIAMPDTAT